VRRLNEQLVGLIPAKAEVLDVGCGDGLLARTMMQKRTDLDIRGIDVSIRPYTHAPVTQFDGRLIPYDDRSFDVVMLIDVIHHTENPVNLLKEAARTARQSILIKDHTREGLLAGAALRMMDKAGNARHGVALPFNYWSRQQWLDAFESLNLKIGIWKKDLKLYPWPASLVFDRSLHFIARLDIS
jgi:SAM-dependent methyltransferase